MCRTLQTMLVDTPLVKNLDNPDYMEILLNGKANLQALFAEIGIMLPAGIAESQDEVDRILPGFRTLINLPTLTQHVVRLFTKPVHTTKSN